MDTPIQDASHIQKPGLASLSQAILASLGVPSFEPGFNLQPADTTVVFMVDGLGHLLLDEHRSRAPFLRTLLGSSQSFRVGFPATTATSLASFAFAQESGRHGIVGSRFALEGQTVFSPLPWMIGSPYQDQIPTLPLVEPPILPIAKTAWEIAGERGLNVECILPANIANSRYSKEIYKGATITPYADYSHCNQQINSVLNKSPRQMIYVYLGELDYAGHIFGTGSESWLNSLQEIDTLISKTVSTLAQGTNLLITADHGMTTLLPELTFDFDSNRHLQEGVAWIAGDIRARHVYVQDDQASNVLERWRNTLGDDFTVLSREQAVSKGLFGCAVEAIFEKRLGDLIVYPTGRGGIVKSTTEKHQTSWKGHHGALTEADQLSPLLTYSNR